MSREVITIIKCDICERAEAKSYFFVYDQKMKTAGSMENVYYPIDLCDIHFDEIVRKYGHPQDYKESAVGRHKSLAYGRKVRSWTEQQIDVFFAMSSEEKKLALQIEEL